MRAAFHDNSRIAQMLLKRGAYANHCDDLRYTALHLASQQGSTKVMEMLLKCGQSVDPNGVGFCDWTPLMLCARKNHMKAAALLILAGADPSLPKSDGITAMHIASAQGYTAMVRLLHAFGAHTVIGDHKGTLPRELATKEGHTGTVDFLDKLSTKSLL